MHHYLTVIELAPDYQAARSNLCNIYRELRQFSEAAGCYKEMSKIKPDAPLTHALIGDSIWHHHNGAAAVRDQVLFHLQVCLPVLLCHMLILCFRSEPWAWTRRWLKFGRILGSCMKMKADSQKQCLLTR